MKKSNSCLLLLFCFYSTNLFCQNKSADSIKFDFPKIIAFCLDANIKPALALFEYDTTKKISASSAKIKTDFENRFKYDFDKSNYLADKKSDIDELLKIFLSYWRSSLLNSQAQFDTILITQLTDFLNKTFPAAKNKITNTDSIDVYLKKYIQSKDLHTSGFGKTGKLYDLLVWKTEKDTVYSFTIDKERISSRVFMLDNFITLGWEEYATLGKYYPGGWATTDALYCVQKAYDLNSENFHISYLAHESRHFADYKLFPKLKSADLEYRAKLTELSLARETIYKLIEFFINNANYESDNGHSIANYCVIRDLSKSIFGVDFEKDASKWKNVDADKINKTAYKILQANTKAMQRIGPDIEKYIKS